MEDYKAKIVLLSVCWRAGGHVRKNMITDFIWRFLGNWSVWAFLLAPSHLLARRSQTPPGYRHPFPGAPQVAWARCHSASPIVGYMTLLLHNQRLKHPEIQPFSLPLCSLFFGTFGHQSCFLTSPTEAVNLGGCFFYTHLAFTHLVSQSVSQSWLCIICWLCQALFMTLGIGLW